ncbi:MAG: mechanosensitive ion channel family protein [Tannerellaceae bacterium]|jgi:small-conductance mechanosensitive channel|nr:mechanosensitive ion channel family protein [Tannerellaceae bacterium]
MKKQILRYGMAFILSLCSFPSLHAQSDSLRAEPSIAVPVVVENDTLFYLHSGQGGLSAARRAENVQAAILQAGKKLFFEDDSLHIEEGAYLTDIMYGEKVLLSITDRDVATRGIRRSELAKNYFVPISTKIAALKKTYGIIGMVKRSGLFVLIAGIQILLIRLTNYAFRKLRRKIIRLRQTRLKPIVIRDYEFLNTRRQSIVLLFFSKMLKWLVILIQLLFSVPMLFSVFPQTKSIAITLFSYVFEPVKMIFRSMVSYIPNLFIIAIIYLCIRYTIKGLRYISREIESGKLKINGFYPDWAQPTFNIIRFLLYAFMIAMIYQYLPGSQSDIFKGISVFVGLIVSLGSTTVIGNIIAGFVITYMRPFKVGDRIKLNDTEGHVIEKTPFVTRLKTPKNEIVTIPNSFIMSSHTTNFSASARDYGLIIHVDVGSGYEVPRRQVHQLLLKAAEETPGVEPQPKPFVLETALKDSYFIYQINAFVRDADHLPKIYSELNQRIHDAFQEAGLELLLPHYYAQRDGNPIAMPPEYRRNVK